MSVDGETLLPLVALVVDPVVLDAVPLPLALLALLDPVALDVAPLAPELLPPELLPPELLAPVETVAFDEEPEEPVLVPAVGSVEVDGVEEAPLEPAGLSALTSAWKSCCSFDSVLLLESDEVADDGFDTS